MKFFVLLLCLFVSIDVFSNDKEILERFSLEDFKPNVPYHETTKWIVAFIPEPTISVEILNKTVSSKTYFRQQGICDGSRAILTGGYFENDEKGLRPVGFHKNVGTQIVAKEPWTSGGYIYQSKTGNVQFLPVKNQLPDGVLEALQAKPFLIEHGRVAVSEAKDQAWDRIAIGDAIYDGKRGLLIVAAISDLSRRRAIRLHHFAEAIVSIIELFHIKLDMALNLDGAQGAFLHFPGNNEYYGAVVTRYIPSVICIY